MKKSILLLLLIFGIVAVHAYILGTESLDVVYQATQGSVNILAENGATVWSNPAYYPLIATNAYGGCLAVADRPYIYQVYVNSTLVSALLQSIIAGTAPPTTGRSYIAVALAKYSIVSLFTPYGYMEWSYGLNNTNITAIATNCVNIAVGTVGGRVLVLGEKGIEATYYVGSPVTYLAYSRDGGTIYVGTSSGSVYQISGGSLSSLTTTKGAVLYIGVNPGAQPYVVSFYKDTLPHIYIWPLGVDLTPSAITEYGTNTPALAAAVSQDGSTLAVGIYDVLYVFRGGSLWYTALLPSAPTAIAVSGNGSIVAVGTLGGQVVVYWNGKRAAEWDAGAPVTSIATSWDGLTVAVETWTAVKFQRLAIGVVKIVDPVATIEISGPEPCINETIDVLSGGTRFTYNVANTSQVLLPVGTVSIIPEYRYLTDYSRCAPLNNVSLTITGNLQQPIVLYYQLQYRVTISPPGLVSGPNWASGTTVYAAQPNVKVLMFGGPAGAGNTADMTLDHWMVNGTTINIPAPSIAVNINGPTSIVAVYKLSAPAVVQINSTARWALKYLTAYDQFGNPVASGPSPYVTTYPITTTAYYVMQYLVATKWPAAVNGSQSLWADQGSYVVFTAPSLYYFKNATRLYFEGWSNGESGNFTAQVEGPMEVDPIYAVQYLVTVKPPGAVNGQSSVWLTRGSTAALNIQPVLNSSGSVRTAFAAWVINGGPGPSSPDARITVNSPMNITYSVKTQYLVSFQSRYGTPAIQQTWADAGSALTVTVTPTQVWAPPPLLYDFKGWQAPDGQVFNSPTVVVTAPGVYTAVWSLNVIPLVAIAAGAGGVAAYFIIRRRRAAAEVEVGAT
ncbi:MAG: WD40 repeat domain-containing protein [Thermoproteus sp.]